MNGKPDTLVVDGLPPLAWERGLGWGCEARWPGWAELAPESEERLSGQISVTFECADVYARTPPSAAQIAAFELLASSGPTIRDAILSEMFDQIQEWSWPGSDWFAERLGEALTEPSQLARLVELNCIAIGASGEEPQADLDFTGEWDPEQGFMAEVSGGQVTYVGSR